MSNIKILQTALFLRKKKKLKQQELIELDKAVRIIAEHPELGVQKKGDLSDVWVYKYKIHRQEMLLAYQWDEATRTLITLGLHENFYRDLKNYKK